jgi:hypothetical protein
LIARARTALGPGLGYVKSLHLRGTISSGTISGTYESWIDLAGGRFAYFTNAGPLTASYGYDGKTAWRGDSKGIVLPQTGPVATRAVATDVFNETDALFSPNHGGASVSYYLRVKDEGKTYEALNLAPANGFPEQVWFDPASALATRIIIDRGSKILIIRIANYRSIAGLMIPVDFTRTERSTVKDASGRERAFVSSTASYKYDLAETPAGPIDAHVKPPPSIVNDVAMAAPELHVPLVLQSSWILVDLRLNGKGPFRMILDSRGENILSPTAAWQSGAHEVGEIPQQGGPTLRYAQVASVEIGDATLRDQYFRVDWLGKRLLTQDLITLDGMIGFELFERLITTIDFSAREIILRKLAAPGVSSNKGKAWLPLAFDDTKPEIDCRIANIATYCIADTASAFALILPSEFVKANPSVWPPRFAGSYVTEWLMDGRSEAKYASVRQLQIGPYRLTDVDTLFSTMNNGALGFYPSPVVGNKIWKDFTVTFDYQNARLGLRRDSSP